MKHIIKPYICLGDLAKIKYFFSVLLKKSSFCIILLISLFILNCCSRTPRVYRFDEHLDEAVIKDKNVVAKPYSGGINFDFSKATTDWIELENAYKLEVQNGNLIAKPALIKEISVEVPDQLGEGIAHLQVLNPPYNEENSSNSAAIKIITKEQEDKVSTYSIGPLAHSPKGERPIIKQFSPSPFILGRHKTLIIIGDNFDPMAKVKFYKQGIEPIIKDQREIIKKLLYIRNINPLNIDTNLIREIDIKMRVKGTSHFFIGCSEDLEESTQFVKVNFSPRKDFFHCIIKPASLRSFQGSIINYLKMKFPPQQFSPYVEIDHIRFLSKSAKYSSQKIGVAQEIINNQLRNGIFMQCPGSLEYRLKFPKGGKLNFGMGILSPQEPVTFSLCIKDKNNIRRLFRKEITNHERWYDSSVKIPNFGTKKVTLIFKSESKQPGNIAFWSNPYLIREDKRDLEERPNIIIYLIDALRADNLGVYGYPRAVSPYIDKIASQGVVFLNCYSSSSWTRPTIPSLLTSLYPPAHGVGDYTFQLPDSIATLAEILHSKGYLTAMMTDNPHVGSTANLQQGFDFLLEQPAISGFYKSRKKDIWLAHNSSALLNQKIFPWLEHNRSIPFFLFIHNMDVHAPYIPPAPFDDMFDPEYTGDINGTFDEDRGFHQAKTPEDIRHVKALYDAEIRNVDEHIRRLMVKLKNLQLAEKTFLIIIADHGEEFLDHENWNHGRTLYNELLKIPLILYYHDKLPQGKRIKNAVSIVDIMPTILELLNISPNPQADGESLIPIINGKKRKQGYLFSSYKGRFFALIDGHWKIIFDIRRGTAELYNLKKDPQERRNLAYREPELVKKYTAIIKNWIRMQNKTLELFQYKTLQRIEIKPEEIEALKALGYLQG